MSESPFATMALQMIVLNGFEPISEIRAKINKYVRINLEANHNQLETTTSEIVDGYRKRHKSHLHVKDVGMLMVTNKKPFRVRFDTNVCQI